MRGTILTQPELRKETFIGPKRSYKITVRWTKEKTKLVDIKERAGSQRTKLRLKEVSEEDLETEKLLQKMKER